MRHADLNKAKILGEMFSMLVKINDVRQSPEWARLSPKTREAYLIIEDMWRMMQDAIRADESVVFELVTYKQMTMEGALFEVVDSMTPQAGREGLDSKPYGLSDMPG